MPTVSFVMPAYKRRFIRKSVDSILAQRNRDFELIIVDDASPENLPEELSSYPWFKNMLVCEDGGRCASVEGVNVRFYQNSKNLGGINLIDAWNHAMSFATGEFAVLASDDDIYNADYLCEMLNLAMEYREVDIFHCRTGSIDENDLITGYGDCFAEYQTCLEFMYFRGIKRYYSTAPEFMFRVSALKKIGGFVGFPVGYFSDDATWYSLARKSGICCSSRMLFLMRSSGINISSRKDNTYAKCLATLKYLDWWNGFVHEIVPIGTMEESLKQKIIDTMGMTTLCFMAYLLHECSLRDAFSIIRKIDCHRWKKRWLFKRWIKRLFDQSIYVITHCCLIK